MATIKRLIEEINTCRSFAKKRTVLRKHGFKIYQGVGRACVHLNEHKVLKIAKNEEGLCQNRIEIRNWVMSSKRHRSYLATIYKFDPQFKWIIAERLQPCKKSVSQRLAKQTYIYDFVWYWLKTDPWETMRQCGFSKKGKLKVYDYGF